ncbi:hypothetical protein GQ457_04G026130 [Hibiscus cannabinus]
MAGIEPRIVGCHSDCIDGDTLFGTCNRNKTCNGTPCCETVIPSALDILHVTFDGESEGCKLALVADEQWFYSNRSDLQTMESVDWSVPFDFEFSRESRCYMNYNTSLRCRCESGYQGNPYLSDGCIDINECLNESYQKICGHDTCVNIPGSYRCEGSKTWTIALGLGVGFGVLCLLIVVQVSKEEEESKTQEKLLQT